MTTIEPHPTTQHVREVRRKPLGTHRSFHDLMLDYDLLIQPSRLAKWRLLFPNTGQLDGFPHFGTVMIAATDGIEAYYHIDESGFLWKGHLKAFNGPVAKVYVWEEDWDYEKRKRKVRVFRRMDGTFAIIPQDTFWEGYWQKHAKMPEWEKELFASCITIDGMSLRRGNVRFEELDSALETMRTRDASPVPRKKEMSARQRILATL